MVNLELLLPRRHFARRRNDAGFETFRHSI